MTVQELIDELKKYPIDAVVLKDVNDSEHSYSGKIEVYDVSFLPRLQTLSKNYKDQVVI